MSRRQTDHGQAELSNMLVKQKALNEIKQERAFTQGLEDCWKIKRKASQNLDDFSKSSWIKTTASCLSHELGVNGENKVN